MDARGMSARRGLVFTAAAFGALLLVCATAAVWVWTVGSTSFVSTRLKIPATRPDAIAGQLTTAFTDAETFWKGVRRDTRFTPARVTFFSARTPTPCAATAVSGSFYCAESNTVAFDTAFLASLGGRLRREAETALALVAGRLAAEHYQREAGILDASAIAMVAARRGDRAAIRAALALQADCLTGAWAASSGLAPVKENAWSNLVTSSRNIVDEMAWQGVRIPREFDLFGSGTREERVEAFAAGYAAASPAVCPDPVLSVSGR